MRNYMMQVQMNGMMQMGQPMQNMNNWGMMHEADSAGSSEEQNNSQESSEEKDDEQLVGHQDTGGPGGIPQVVRGAQDADEGAGGGPEAAASDHPAGRGQEEGVQAREDDEGVKGQAREHGRSVAHVGEAAQAD